MVNDEKFESVAESAIGRLESFFKDDEPTSQQIGAARIASSVLSAWTRHKQTEGAREASTFMMARELATDKEALERYVRVAMPSSPIVQALGQAPVLPAARRKSR